MTKRGVENETTPLPENMVKSCLLPLLRTKQKSREFFNRHSGRTRTCHGLGVTLTRKTTCADTASSQFTAAPQTSSPVIDSSTLTMLSPPLASQTVKVTLISLFFSPQKCYLFKPTACVIGKAMVSLHGAAGSSLGNRPPLKSCN